MFIHYVDIKAWGKKRNLSDDDDECSGLSIIQNWANATQGVPVSHNNQAHQVHWESVRKSETTWKLS